MMTEYHEWFVIYRTLVIKVEEVCTGAPWQAWNLCWPLVEMVVPVLAWNPFPKRMNMKRLTLILVAFLFLCAVPVWAGTFPDLVFSGGLTDAQKRYLGVASEEFKVSEIKSDYLFIEMYSMYCPLCQQDAPKINDLFYKVVLAGRDDRLKFIGLAAGNTQFEVDFYRKKFNVDFPLFEDGDYVMHKALGEVGTPTFYLVELKGGSMEILFFQEGQADDKDGLLKIIMDKTGD
jgi:thiol-disulfide isomerase/thioredoxin